MKHPQKLFVAIENEGDNEEYLNAQRSEKDFSYDDKPKRKIAVYKLEKIITVERRLEIEADKN